MQLLLLLSLLLPLLAALITDNALCHCSRSRGQSLLLSSANTTEQKHNTAAALFVRNQASFSSF
jgi:hypothetical protein